MEEVGVCYMLSSSSKIWVAFITQPRPVVHKLVEGRYSSKNEDETAMFRVEGEDFWWGYGNAGSDMNYNRRNKTNGFYRPVLGEEQSIPIVETRSEIVQNSPV